MASTDPADTSRCNAHGYWIDNACACFARYSGPTCEVETSWVDAYSGMSLSLTAIQGNRLLCVQTDPLHGNPVLTTCLSDDTMSNSYFTIIRVDSSSMYIMATEFADVYLISDGDSMTARQLTQNEIISEPGALFQAEIVSESLMPSIELVAMKTFNNGFLCVNNTNAVKVQECSSFETSAYLLVNEKQVCG